MKRLYLILILLNIAFAKNCFIPKKFSKFVLNNDLRELRKIKDIDRNYNIVKEFCVYLLSFNEHKINWKMLLVYNPKKPYGLFWFIPHDNENSAFDSGLYAIRKYGGGLLAIINKDKRYNRGQDPNRNFSYSKLKICKEQKASSKKYTTIIFDIIDYFKYREFPYLSLHNNTNKGGISILKRSKKVKSYFAYPVEEIINGKALKDEDNLIYMAGSDKKPPKILKEILRNGMSVKYEIVNRYNNDCSMSNFIVIEKKTNNYFNVEAQKNDIKTQKLMIDKLVNIITKEFKKDIF